jgi:HK97 family phage major capsid protein
MAAVSETPARFEGRDELEQRQADIKSELRELDDQFKGQSLPEDEKTRWNTLNEEFEQIDGQIRELEARYVRLTELAEKPENREEPTVQSFQTGRPGVTRGGDIWDLTTVRTVASSPEGIGDELRDRGKRAIESLHFPHERANREYTQGHLERLLYHTQESMPGETARHFLATGSPLYRRAFGKALFGRPLSNEETRALSLAGAGGGYAVPLTLDPTVIPTSNSVVNPTRAIARVETITGSNTWNGVSSGAIVASRVAEATAATDNAPTLAQPTATVTKAHAFVPFSVEIEEDWTGMQSEIARLLQDAKDDEEGTAFVTGAGTGVNPQGFVTGTTATVAAATGLTVTAANLYALEAALPPRFRPNESFVANRGIYNVIRAIDSAGGAALWLYVSQGLVTQAPTPGNTGATLLGRGAWEASAMQATVVNATKIMVVGDFNYFLIVDRIGLHIEVIPHLFGAAQGNLPTGQRGFYCWWRNTSRVLSASAFVALTGTT